MREPTIENASELKKDLLAAFGKAKEVTIDVSDVTTIDLAGFQVLVALWREGAKRGVPVKFTGMLSKAFSERLSGLGLGEVAFENGVQLTDYFARLCN